MAMLALLIGCTQQDDNVIRIGAAGPMTGDQSKMGIDLRNGVELAVAEWNEKGGVLGKKIQLVPGDDQADPKQAVSIANKFINQKVVALVGHWNSSCSINASHVLQRREHRMHQPCHHQSPADPAGVKKVFRVCGTDDQQGGVAAEFVLKTLKPKRVAVIHDKTTYGQGLADYFKKALERQGAGRLLRRHPDQRDPDYKAVLTSIKEKKPERLFLRRRLS